MTPNDTIPPATLADARASFRALGETVGACIAIAFFLALVAFGVV